MAKNNKAVILLAFGTFVTFLGTGIICGGGFNSVMQVPTDGPYQDTRVPAAGVGSNPTIATTFDNRGHYVSLLKQYPQLFNWSKIKDLQKSADVTATFSGALIDQQFNRDAANAYTQYHAGEQAWIFAFYLPIALVVVGLGFTALLRKSGHTLALVGLGLTATMITYTLIIVVHYQNISFVPEVLNAFSDCTNNAVVDRAALLSGSGQGLATGVAYGTLIGPANRRAWLCKDDWTYDNDFRVAANLVWGGAATCFVGYLSLLVGFAYLVHPFVTPVPAFAKTATRGADVDFDDYSYDSEESDY